MGGPPRHKSRVESLKAKVEPLLTLSESGDRTGGGAEVSVRAAGELGLGCRTSIDAWLHETLTLSPQ